MATSPLPFLVSLILFFSLSPLSLCATESPQLFPSPVTPKTAAVQYWNLKVGNNKPLPPAFLSKLSSQSPLELLITDSDNMKSMVDDETSEKIRGFWATLYHDEMREKIRTWAILYHDQIKEKLRTWAIIYHDEMREKMLREQLADDIFVNDDTPGICFREGDLKQGNVMPFVDFRGLFPDQHFVPRSVASKMPFTSADDIKKMFHMSSATSKGMEETVKLCNRVTSPDEQKKCITSAEDMIDYVIQTLGSNDIEARNTESTRGCGSDILIGDLKALNGGKFTDVVTCHQMQFPYLVHYCHSIAKTRVYEVEILDAETKEKINRAIATCHMISLRNPADDASKKLESQPGNIEVCHFISPWDMVWTAAAPPDDQA